MAGGEPFLIRGHRRIWELLEELEQAPIVSVTTNGTIWNDYVESVLDAFDTNICVSVDGVTPETFEQIRVGSSFDVVMANLDRFRRYADERGTGVFLSFSLLKQNWFELGPLLRFAEEHGISVSVQTVHEVDFGVQWLETAELQLVVEMLEAEDREIWPAHCRSTRSVWNRQKNHAVEDGSLTSASLNFSRPSFMAPPSPDSTTRIESGHSGLDDRDVGRQRCGFRRCDRGCTTSIAPLNVRTTDT